MSKINYSQTTLFDVSKLIPRPLPDQEQFISENRKFLFSLVALSAKSFEMTYSRSREKLPLSMNRIWFANEMNGNLLSLVAQDFPEYVKPTGRGSFALMVNFKYECYLKKLNSKTLKPSYNHSNSSKALMNQDAKKNEHPVPVIYLGWTNNKYKDLLTGYYAVCWQGNQKLWKTDLRTLNVIEIDKHLAEETQQKPVTIKIKNKKKAN
jgi:hypothetical protein